MRDGLVLDGSLFVPEPYLLTGTSHEPSERLCRLVALNRHFDVDSWSLKDRILLDYKETFTPSQALQVFYST